MKVPDSQLVPDWDESNVEHIARHGVIPEQVEEVYYGEGPVPTLGVRLPARGPSGSHEHRYRLWGTDASGTFLEAIMAPFPTLGIWRCVTAYPMSKSARRAYLRRIRR